MKIKGVILDFGFTLFEFKEVSLQKYFECYKQGLVKSIDRLKNLEVLRQDETVIKDFIELFKKKREFCFKESLKSKIEYPTTYIFKSVLESMVEKKIINSIEGVNDNLLKEIATLYHSIEENEWIPFKETRDTLKKISELKDVKIAVLSNHPHHQTIKNLLQKHDLLEFFDTIVTSAKFGKRKPHLEIFNFTLKKLGLENEANSCLICGDEHADVVGGYNAGIKPIWFKRKYKFPYEKEITMSNLIEISNISEILNYIT
jgi:HAD superfamily hydrolase (TIGR01549 family)